MFKEKFIIHSQMNQDEIRKKLEENVQKGAKPLNIFANQKYFQGEINGYNFRIRRMVYDEAYAVHCVSIQGQIKESSIFITMGPGMGTNCIGFLTCAFIFYAVSNNFSYDSIFILFFAALLSFLVIQGFKMGVTTDTAYLKKLFNGTIEKQT